MAPSDEDSVEIQVCCPPASTLYTERPGSPGSEDWEVVRNTQMIASKKRLTLRVKLQSILCTGAHGGKEFLPFPRFLD